MRTICPACKQDYVALACTWCHTALRQEQREILELIDMLMADRDRRRLEHEKRIVKVAYWLGRKMACYEVTKADALRRIEGLALAYWDDVTVPLHITQRGREIGVAALTQGLKEGQRGRRAA